MKASLLKRLQALEDATNRRVIPPLRLIDATKLPDVDRDAILNGDTDALNRIAPVVPDLPPGTVQAIVVSLNPESRDVWEATRGMSDDEYDAWNDARIRESERKEPEPVPKTVPTVVFDQWGYRIR